MNKNCLMLRNNTHSSPTLILAALLLQCCGTASSKQVWEERLIPPHGSSGHPLLCLDAVVQHPFSFQAALSHSDHSPRVANLTVTHSKQGYAQWLCAENVPSQWRIWMITRPEITSKGHSLRGEGLKNYRAAEYSCSKIEAIHKQRYLCSV